MKRTLSAKAKWCYAFCLMAGNLVYMLTASVADFMLWTRKKIVIKYTENGSAHTLKIKL